MPDRAFIDQLADVWQGISTLCRGLGDTEWDLPTDCPGWTVRDQLSHVIGTESMLLGRTAPPAAPAGLAHVRNPIGEINEAWIEARRGSPGPVLIDEFDEVTGARLAAVRAMSDADLDAVTPSPIGNVPYATFMDVRIMDCWVHEQDIRRATGRPGGLDTAPAATALRRFASSLGFVVGKRTGAPDGTTVVFDLSGPHSQVLAVGVQGGRAQPVAAPDEPSVRIAMDTETFACLVAGRRDPDGAKVTYVGDEPLGRSIVANLATIP
ncbi:MAG: maleylpyruvate isomerase family mycothiol-dependent enzyme [Acidimicrobiales bacterium]